MKRFCRLAPLLALALLLVPSLASSQASGRAEDPAAWDLGLPKLEALSATRERPLFVPSRRPPPPPVEQPAPEQEEVEVAQEETTPPPFELAGIVTGSSVNVAMLRNTATQDVQRVQQGQTIEGWTLAEVGARHVMLSRDGMNVRMQLFEEGKGPRRPAQAQSRFDEQQFVNGAPAPRYANPRARQPPQRYQQDEDDLNQ